MATNEQLNGRCRAYREEICRGIQDNVLNPGVTPRRLFSGGRSCKLHHVTADLYSKYASKSTKYLHVIGTPWAPLISRVGRGSRPTFCLEINYYNYGSVEVILTLAVCDKCFIYDDDDDELDNLYSAV